jgi:autoinducer 2 (AI-2) kinase
VHFFAEAESSSPGACGTFSTFGALVMNARELQMPLGSLTLTWLSAGNDPRRRRHLERAVLEGIVFAQRVNFEQIVEATGVRPGSVRVTGGLSRSRFYAQLLADVLELPVEVTRVPEATALAAALCAGVGAGVFADLGEAAERSVTVAHRCQPDSARAAVYRELRPVWDELRLGRKAVDAAATGYWLRGLAAAAGSAPPRAAASFRPRILVTANLDDASLEALAAVGEVEDASYRKRRRILKGDPLREALAGFHVLVTEVDVVEAKVLAAARDLRLLAVCRGDAVNVDLEAATALGIPVLHTPGRNADAVADLTLAFLLMLARKLVPAAAYLREPGEAGDPGRMGRAYAQLRGRELWRKTVGLVGLGAVGRKVVQRVRACGARCLVYDPFLEPDRVRLAEAEPAGLEELLRSSDFVTLHANVSESSRGLIGARELALLRPTACLVNTARAALVDEAALAEALREGRLAGAALDVFSVEPPGPDHPLVQLPNVISTPHVGGNTEDVPAHQGAIVAEELARVARGEAPRFALNRAVLEGFDWSRPRPEPDPELLKELGRGPAPAMTDLQRDSAARSR